MRPQWHLGFAAAGTLPYYLMTGSLSRTALFAAAAVAVDVDHVLDYVLWNERPLSYAGFMRKGALLRGRRMMFFLHGYEWLILAYAFSWWFGIPALPDIANGVLLHLAVDEVGNRLPSSRTRIHAPFYFFSYRLYKRFRIDKMCIVNKP